MGVKGAWVNPTDGDGSDEGRDDGDGPREMETYVSGRLFTQIIIKYRREPSNMRTGGS